MGEGRHLTDFPEHLPLLREQVARVSFWHALYPDDKEAFIGTRLQLNRDGFEELYDSYDFCVEMKDGRNFVFTACTPEWVRDYMHKEGEISFVESGLVIVDEISIDAMLNALQKCLAGADTYGLEHFGILSEVNEVKDMGDKVVAEENEENT